MDIKEKRNQIGQQVFFVLGILLGIFAELIMIAREYYQSKKYNFPIEKDDIRNYSELIFFGSCIHYFIVLLLILIFL